MDNLDLLINDTLTKDQLSLVHEEFNYLVYRMEMGLETFLLRLKDTYPEHLETIEQTTKMLEELQQLDTKILENLKKILGPLVRWFHCRLLYIPFREYIISRARLSVLSEGLYLLLQRVYTLY